MATRDAAELRQVELWSDVEASTGGSRLSVVRDVLAATERVEVGDSGHLGRESLKVEMPLDDPAWSDVREGRVVRVEISDGETSEWRIFKINRKRRSEGDRRGMVTCESIAYDLKRWTPLVSRTESQHVDIDFQLLSLTPTEWIDRVILKTSGFPSWITRGTVSSSDELSMRVDGVPAGVLLDRIAEVVGDEWTLRRDGSTGYKIDVVAQRGSTSPDALVALKRNMLSASHETTAEKQATRIYPRGGGPQGFRATMADAKWKVTSITS